MDRYFSREFAEYSGGRPYLSLRVVRGADNRFAFSGECWLNSECMPVTDFLTVGALVSRDAAHCAMSAGNGQDDFRKAARVVELLGGNNLKRLKTATVGVVGCSGTGSPAAHVLARAGVGAFVLVDPQDFEPSNHERFHASNSDDLGQALPKVELVRRMVLNINPQIGVTEMRANVLDEGVLDQLLRCDLVLGCTDTQHSRAALSDYATHYMLPCIDSAVLLRAKNGKLTEQVGELARYTPEEPCAWCIGRIDQKRIWYELMSDNERQARRLAATKAIDRGIDGEQYWGGDPPQEN